MVDLVDITLDKGAHRSREQGVCAAEAIAWLADEPHSDHPKCLSPVLGAFLRNWNDSLDSEGRAKLKPFLPRAIGTAGDGHDEARAWMCTDWLVRVCAPAWLELAGVKDAPSALRALPPLTDAEATKAALPTINSARAAGAAAWAAAGAAARAAAWAAAGAAAGAAARAAARAAAWDAARDAAGVAAWAAARAAAWAAAGDAAWDALDPTKVELQASALVLLERMVSLGGSSRRTA